MIAKQANERATRPGFTLVELLVVIGIIAVLVSILLPTLGRARRAAQVTKCLSNIRQLSVAVNGYMAENRGTLPEAYFNNRDAHSPSFWNLNPWSPRPTAHPAGIPYVMPTIGTLLAPYVGAGTGVWQCPTGGPDFNSKDPYLERGDEPLGGLGSANQWLPNYYYMNNKVYAGTAVTTVAGARAYSPDGVAAPFNSGDWAVRNIAGLRSGRTRTVSGQGGSEIVIFTEYKSTFHTQATRDIYQLQAGENSKYLGNYGYLDGHAETREYRNRNEYMRNLHDPIEQSWFGIDYKAKFAEFYQPVNWYR
jgi:prepilin-type N-terminal cleavage/methylation domain-containing protein/prepilin-type processing-associated H-X9-DG protein